MDFTKGVKKIQKKYGGKGGTKGTVTYNPDRNIFTVKYKGREYITRGSDFKDTDIVYSLPANNKHEAWTRKIGIGTNFDIIRQYWTTIHNGQKVYCGVKDGVFYIDYNKTYG